MLNFLVLSQGIRYAHWLLGPLSREGRGEVFFECNEYFLSGRGIKPLFAPALDPSVPSPLAGEGQGEGGKAKPKTPTI